MSVTDHAPLDVSYADDPRVVAEAAVDDCANHVVPLSARMGRGSLTMAWYGVASAIFYVVTGAAVAAAYGTKQALVGLVLTIAVYGAINYVISSAAAQSGLSVAMFSRSMFGLVGAALATLIFAATAGRRRRLGPAQRLASGDTSLNLPPGPLADGRSATRPAWMFVSPMLVHQTRMWE